MRQLDRDDIARVGDRLDVHEQATELGGQLRVEVQVQVIGDVSRGDGVAVGELHARAHRVLVLERAHRLPRRQDPRFELLLGPVDEHLALDQRHHRRREPGVVARPEQRPGRGCQAPDQSARQGPRLQRLAVTALALAPGTATSVPSPTRTRLTRLMKTRRHPRSAGLCSRTFRAIFSSSLGDTGVMLLHSPDGRLDVCRQSANGLITYPVQSSGDCWRYIALASNERARTF